MFNEELTRNYATTVGQLKVESDSRLVSAPRYQHVSSGSNNVDGLHVIPHNISSKHQFPQRNVAYNRGSHRTKSTNKQVDTRKQDNSECLFGANTPLSNNSNKQ